MGRTEGGGPETSNESRIPEENTISTRVFVGNLSYDVTQDEIETLFSQSGEIVEVFLPTDRMTGRPRGFAFVEFKEAAAASAAIEKLNGQDLKGRALRVNMAEERAPRPRGGFSGPPPDLGGFGGKPAKSKGSRRNIRRSKRSL